MTIPVISALQRRLDTRVIAKKVLANVFRDFIGYAAKAENEFEYEAYSSAIRNLGSEYQIRHNGLFDHKIPLDPQISALPITWQIIINRSRSVSQLDSSGYNSPGARPKVNVTVMVPADRPIKLYFNRIYGMLLSAIAHETTHYLQDNRPDRIEHFNSVGVDMSKAKTLTTYLLSEAEIEAWVRSIVTQGRHQKIPFPQMAAKLLDDKAGILSVRQKQRVMAAWMEYYRIHHKGEGGEKVREEYNKIRRVERVKDVALMAALVISMLGVGYMFRKPLLAEFKRNKIAYKLWLDNLRHSGWAPGKKLTKEQREYLIGEIHKLDPITRKSMLKKLGIQELK